VTDDLDWPARQGEEAIRQLDMLRHTLKERLRECKQSHHIREAVAYQDVLSLLGPEPAWTVDPDTKEPF
jgi:hypothetical protein